MVAHHLIWSGAVGMKPCFKWDCSSKVSKATVSLASFKTSPSQCESSLGGLSVAGAFL